MSNFHEQLAVLKNAMQSKPAGERCNGQPNPAPCAMQIEKYLAEKLYKAAKAAQAQSNYKIALERIRSAIVAQAPSKAANQLYRARRAALERLASPEPDSLDQGLESYLGLGFGEAGVLTEMRRRTRIAKPEQLLIIPELDAFSALGVYRFRGDPRAGERLSRLIVEAKRGQGESASFLGSLLVDHWLTDPQIMDWRAAIDLVVPVPSAHNRVLERGLAVVEAIAQRFAARVGLPFRQELLHRVADGAQSRDSSRAGVQHQYYGVRDLAERVAGRCVLVVDDVCTRGYTLSAIAALLKEAGASEVRALVVAQAETSHRAQIYAGETVALEAEKLAPWLCLADAPMLGPSRLRALMTRFGSPASVLEASPEAVRKTRDIGPKLVEAIQTQAGKQSAYRAIAAQQLSEARAKGGVVLTQEDPRYPKRLLASGYGPAVLYAMGDEPDLAQELHTIAIVGSRKLVEGIADQGRAIAKVLAGAGWLVVSGLAEGADSAGHAAAIEAGGKTAAFLGCGPDILYPPSAKALQGEILRNGMIYSEYPFGRRVSENQLRKRNQLIAGAAAALVVLQSATDGGAMNAARAASAINVPIFCLPPREGAPEAFSGNRKLLADGALEITPNTALDRIQCAVRPTT